MLDAVGSHTGGGVFECLSSSGAAVYGRRTAEPCRGANEPPWRPDRARIAVDEACVEFDFGPPSCTECIVGESHWAIGTNRDATLEDVGGARIDSGTLATCNATAQLPHYVHTEITLTRRIDDLADSKRGNRTARVGANPSVAAANDHNRTPTQNAGG